MPTENINIYIFKRRDDMDNIAIDVKNVSVKFNLAMAKYDGLKEYVINLIKGRD